MINFTQRERKILLLLADIILISAAVYLAFLLRFDGKIPSQYFGGVFQGAIILALFFSLPLFYFFRLYAFSWAYVSTNELISLAKALIISFSFSGATLLIFGSERIFQGFPRSTLFISFILIFIFCGGIRFGKRIFSQIFQKVEMEGKERTLIVGADDKGEQILRGILSSKDSPYFPVGLVDGDSSKRGETIHGIKVLGEIDDIPQIIQNNQIEQIIIPLPSAGGNIIKRVFEKGREAGLKMNQIKKIPLSEIIDGVSLKDLREIQVDDLLGREPALLDTNLVKNFIQNKIILITGAAGSIGSELCYQVAKFNPSLLLILDQDETGIFNLSGELENKFPRLKIFPIITDIQDEKKIENIFDKFRPSIVFHAAAYKHVPLMEENPDEAVKNNIFGTKVVAEKALKFGAERFIFVSTDKAVNPTSVMGMTKRLGEIVCQTLNQKNQTKLISVRFGNVLDSRGSVIPIFREKIKKREALEVTHPEMKRYFMLISEACLLVMQAGAMGEGGEVFVLDMGKPIKILDLAKEMIKLSGLEPDKDIQIIFTEPRPGENLFEEILTAEEGVIATQNQKIFRAKLSAVDEKKLNDCLKKLEKATQKAEREEMVNILKDTLQKLIPSYKISGG